MSEAKKERVRWLDSLKGFGILLIVVGHFVDPSLRQYFYSYNAPLFFVICGYWAAETNGGWNIGKRAKRLLLPYVAWWFVSVPFQILWSSPSLSELVCRFFYIKGTTVWNEPLWFLATLFQIDLLARLLTRRDNGLVTAAGACLALVGAYAAFRFPPPFYYFGANKMLLGMFYYLLGALLVHVRMSRAWIAGALMIMIGLLTASRVGVVSYYAWLFYSFRYLILTSVLVSVGLLLLFRGRNWSVSFLDVLGQHTIFVMASHYFVMELWSVLVSRAHAQCGWDLSCYAPSFSLALLAAYYGLFKVLGERARALRRVGLD